MKRNCPNCGAQSESLFCPYCDTPLFDPVESVLGSNGKLCHVWYEDKGRIFCFDVLLESVDFHSNTESLFCFGSTSPCMEMVTRNPEVTFTGPLMDHDPSVWEKLVKWNASRNK